MPDGVPMLANAGMTQMLDCTNGVTICEAGIKKTEVLLHWSLHLL